MAKVRVEFIRLVAPVYGAGLTLIPDGQLGNAVEVDTSAPQTLSAPNGSTHARITVRSGDVIVDWGKTPAASATKGLLFREGIVDAVPVRGGQNLSIITAPAV